MPVKDFFDRFKKQEPEADPIDLLLQETSQAYKVGGRTWADQVAPTVYEEFGDHVRVGDVFMRYYYVADVPQGTMLNGERFLRPGAQVWVSFHVRPLPPQVAANLHRRQTELAGSAIFDSRRGSMGDYRRQAELSAVDEALQEIELGQRPIYHFALYMAIIADTEEGLEAMSQQVEDYMQGARVAFHRAKWQQVQLEYSLLPAGTDRMHVYRNMTAGALGPLFPFTRRTYYEPEGFPWGVHRTDGTWVILDPFSDQVMNASTLILGRPGTGKSSLLKRLVEISTLLGQRVIVVDLEGEYEPLIDDLGGKYISLSRTCSWSINILDPGLGDDDPFGAGLSSLLGFMGIACGRPLTAMERQSLVPYCYHALLEQSGVDIDDASTWQTAKQPTLLDLQRLMEEEGGPAAELARLLYPYTTDNMYGRLFSRPTNVDISTTPVVGFTLQGVSEDMLAPFLWLVVNRVWREVAAAGGVQPVHLVVDEGWYLMRHSDVSVALADMARRFRKHQAALHLATHFASDLIATEHAAVIRGAAGNVLLLGQQPEETKAVGELFNLTAVEMKQLKSFGQGDALLLWDGGRHRIPIYMPLDPRRQTLFFTGAQQRLEHAQRHGIDVQVVE